MSRMWIPRMLNCASAEWYSKNLLPTGPGALRMAAFRDPEGFVIEIVGPLDPDEPLPTYE